MLKINPPDWRLIASFLVVLMTLTAQPAYSNESIKADGLNGKLSNVQITKNIASMPLAFTKNQGQWDDKVSFRANANGATMWFSPDGAYYQFTRSIPTDELNADSVNPMYDRFDREPIQYETMMIKA